MVAVEEHRDVDVDDAAAFEDAPVIRNTVADDFVDARLSTLLPSRCRLQRYTVEAKNKPLTIQEFLRLSEAEANLELISGRAVAKVSPQYSHASVQTALVLLLAPWVRERGRVRTEWSIVLRRKERDWVPVPDVLYVSYGRLPTDWFAEGPCPVAPELAVEILSPDQTFGEMTAKATDYLVAGVERVWVIDPAARSLTIFYSERAPVTLRGDQTMSDSLFAQLLFSPHELFKLSGLPSP